MSYVIPVVASRTGGMIESLGSYPGVFFVPPEDPVAIANALVQVFQDLGKRYEAPEELRWDQVARKWKSLLSSAGIG